MRKETNVLEQILVSIAVVVTLSAIFIGTVVISQVSSGLMYNAIMGM